LDGHPTATRRELMQRLLNRLGESGEINFTVQYPGSNLVYETSAELTDWLKGAEEPDPIEGLGLKLYRPAIKMVLSSVQADSPAATAGLQKGDRLLSADGEDLAGWDQWVDYVQARAGQSIAITYERDGQQHSANLTPKLVELDGGRKVGRVGMAASTEPWPKEMIIERDYSVLESFGVALNRTWEQTGFVFVSLKKLILGEISPKNLSGPITIAKVAGDTAKLGWQNYVGFLALLSVFLGVMNLLPIPVLDGGHLLYYLIELVKGSPLSERVQQWGYQVGLVLVLGLMAVALYNDFARAFSS
ncbi:MAG: RIP metalloprotease RseP, partial [Cellvibrionaceae bacterium]|nr:RIP metalloprotease RseP [Cellvibrionaceae bacterium]